METVERWTTRSDAWTADDDRKLAEIVLRHIREGSTQLNAFVESANLLGRTPAACGYRWNGVVRKHYEDGIKEAKSAKKERLSIRQQAKQRRVYGPDLDDTSIDGIIRALKNHEREYFNLQEKSRLLEQKVIELEIQLHQLAYENNNLRTQNGQSPLTEDSKTLLEIMDRARRILELEQQGNGQPRFHLAEDGDLEALESGQELE
ncbi:RsfA family transcriptional regulator [Tumebacillus permanentifrigoris]|uniref:Prespore-specific regulator n=1 Tax=Tumebacillus permanentifrigoris TaxID=378543 RepID=A0A316DW56_9BACL|nr:RsfA family transcriptional regulator [Tumebacillus permanentifrigoris]PWK13784.1 prespore-specific regulator [Tumebacillus permanentifrigoris]